MAAHPSVLAWRIPGMGEPGGLPSMGSHRVGHDWSVLAAAAAALQWASLVAPWVKNPPANEGTVPGSGRFSGGGNSNPPTPVFLPGESYGQRSLADYSPWGRKESDTAEWRNNSFPLRAVPVSLCLFVFPPLYCLISHLSVWNAFLNAETAFSVGENTPHHYHFPFEEIFMCM